MPPSPAKPGGLPAAASLSSHPVQDRALSRGRKPGTSWVGASSSHRRPLSKADSPLRRRPVATVAQYPCCSSSLPAPRTFWRVRKLLSWVIPFREIPHLLCGHAKEPWSQARTPGCQALVKPRTRQATPALHKGANNPFPCPGHVRCNVPSRSQRQVPCSGLAMQGAARTAKLAGSLFTTKEQCHVYIVVGKVSCCSLLLIGKR